MAADSNSRPPCASCKQLRRRCTADCVFAPYFPVEDRQRFDTVHRIYGSSNVARMLHDLPAAQRADAVSSLVYEANARKRDPVYGCAGAIYSLQQQIARLQMQLAVARAHMLHHHRSLPSSLTQQHHLLDHHQQQQQHMDMEAIIKKQHKMEFMEEIMKQQQQMEMEAMKQHKHRIEIMEKEDSLTTNTFSFNDRDDHLMMDYGSAGNSMLLQDRSLRFNNQSIWTPSL